MDYLVQVINPQVRLGLAMLRLLTSPSMVVLARPSSLTAVMSAAGLGYTGRNAWLQRSWCVNDTKQNLVFHRSPLTRLSSYR
jgi:hypothetical protein